MEKTNGKPDQHQRRVLCAALMLTALFCLALWYMQTGYVYDTSNYRVFTSENGVWDMTDFDFTDGFAKAQGQAEYIPGALLTPAEFAAREGEALIGHAAADPVNTSRLRFLVPEGGVYMVAGHSVDFAERVYINGELRKTVGAPGLTAEAFMPGYACLQFEARPEGGVIEIVRQTGNFVHRENGSPQVIQRKSAVEEGVAVFKMGLFFTLFLAHGLLFLILRGYRANLYFALLCLTWCARCGVVGEKLLLRWFVSLSWYAVFRLEYLTGPVAALLLLLVIAQVFPGALPGWLVRGGVGLFVAYGVFCLLAPTLPLSWSMLGFQAVYILMMAVFAALLSARMRRMVRDGRARAEHWLTLAGLALFLLAATHDALYYNNVRLPINAPLNDIALLLFALLQMTAVFLATLREVREAREQEQRLRDENAALDKLNRLKGEFLQSISHEMKTPLTVMSGYAQLTAWQMDAGVADAGTRENLRTISREAQRLSALVSQLLRVSEEHSMGGDGESVPVPSLLNRAAALCGPVLAKNGNRLTTHGGEDCPPVRGGADMILQVLLNLAANAGRHQKNKAVALTVEQVGGMAVFTMADEGDGIPPELLPHVFERGVSGDGGTGLGLSICRDVVETLGGNIHIESGAGCGIRVTFMLPLDLEDEEDETNHPDG